MTQQELSYMCWEILRAGHVVDDERLDIRLLYDWVDLKRAKFIEQSVSKNPNSRISLNMYQKLPVTIDISMVTDAGDYPYVNDTTQIYEIIQSTTDIPRIIEGKNGPLVLSLESQDAMKLPFSLVDYDYLRFSGNGKFNKNIIFGSIRDNKLYFKYNEFFEEYTNVILRAVFESPSDISGYDKEVSPYPIDLSFQDYIKSAILEEDISKFLKGVTDEASDSTGEIIK